MISFIPLTLYPLNFLPFGPSHAYISMQDTWLIILVKIQLGRPLPRYHNKYHIIGKRYRDGVDVCITHFQSLQTHKIWNYKTFYIASCTPGPLLMLKIDKRPRTRSLLIS